MTQYNALRKSDSSSKKHVSDGHIYSGLFVGDLTYHEYMSQHYCG